MKPLFLSVLSVISVILAVTGLGVLVWGFRRMQQSSAMKDWPTTQGTIRSSTVVSREAAPLNAEESYDDDAPKPKPQVLYRPDVEYTYTVNGETYTGNLIAFDVTEVSSKQHAQAQAARFVPRAPVTVYYDPEDPQHALLEPGVQAASWAIPGAGAACIFIATAFYFFIRWFSGR
jgi:hypothetical protein